MLAALRLWQGISGLKLSRHPVNTALLHCNDMLVLTTKTLQAIRCLPQPF